MPLEECFKRHTYRQYYAWMAWLDKQWSVPSRTDYYLMQIAQAVSRVLSKKPKAIKLKHFKLSFGESNKPKPSKLSADERTAASKARWGGIFAAYGWTVEKLEKLANNGKTNGT